MSKDEQMTIGYLSRSFTLAQEDLEKIDEMYPKMGFRDRSTFIVWACLKAISERSDIGAKQVQWRYAQ